MPKRAYDSESDESDYLSYKIKKLKKRLKQSRQNKKKSNKDTSTFQDDQVEALWDSPPNMPTDEALSSEERDETLTTPKDNLLSTDNPLSQILENGTDEINPTNEGNDPIDPDVVVEILGVDPGTTFEYGTDIHGELASRLQHIATSGLTKDTRKELNERFLIPANSIHIGAPLLNAEIKVAVSETVLKRDKGIEARQKQLAAAISGLAGILTRELSNKNKENNTNLKELMDVCRILCDIQYAESTTRRNFAIYSLKKELKGHLSETRIDKYLFGENLAEALRTANAVTKSGTELKPKPMPKVKSNLNWKSPAPVRKQQSTQRGREAAPLPAPGPSTRYNRNKMHYNSSKTLQHQQKFNRRR